MRRNFAFHSTQVPFFQGAWDIMDGKLRSYKEIKNSTNTNSTHIHVPRQHTWKTHLSCVAQLMGTRTMNKNGLFLNSL